MLAAAIPPELPLDDGQRATPLEVPQRVVECSRVQACEAVEAFDEWYAQARRAAGMDNKLADDQDEFGPFVRVGLVGFGSVLLWQRDGRCGGGADVVGRQG